VITKLKRRSLARIDVRQASEGDPSELFGYAALFNVESSPLFDEDVCKGPFVEVIHPDAFTRTLAENPDVRALYNHNTDFVLGRTTSGTLDLSVDTVGVPFALRLSTASYARDAAITIQRRDVDGCSFGFAVVEDSLELRPGLPPLHTLIDVDLFEISTGVAFPAYEGTTVETRSHKRITHQIVRGTPRLNHARRRLELYRLASDL
jgi:HK97 family phage prohead protease